MRVYEYAKEKKMTSKAVLELLKSAGFEVSTHMAVLTDDALRALEKNEMTISSDVKKTTPEKSQVDKELKEVQAKPVVKKEEIKKTVEKETISKALKTNEPKKSEIVEPSKRISGKKQEAQKEALVAPTKSSTGTESKVIQSQKQQAPKVITEITIDKDMSLFEVADLMGKPAGDLIVSLLKKGMVCNRNQVLNLDTITYLANQFGIKVSIPERKASINQVKKISGVGKIRPPIVVVMGHVDHGKTTLLDYIRKTSVALHEKGGITQHIGAYEVNTTHGKVTFLDTPGHAAFSHMRKRGARITDIAILVVAADDGIMPQTVEAIECAQAAGVPIIVAINKVDKVTSTAPIESIKRQLAEKDLLPEDWGGSTICVPISAKTGQGVEALLEMVVLQSQLMELTANVDVPAKAYIIESNIEKGYGSVATVIPTEGILRQGDYFVCGSATGKVRLLLNSSREKILEAEPSVPAVVIGFDKLASSGDLLEVVSYETYLQKRSQKEDFVMPQAQMAQAISAAESPDKFINLIIKTDTFGSNEALVGSIKAISKKTKGTHTFKIISTGVGDVSERDVLLAIDTEAIIIALHTKVEKNAAVLAKENKIEIKQHQIIYHLLEELENILAKHKHLILVTKKTGEAIVRKVFDIKGQGVVAGSYCTDGTFTRNAKVICLRRGKQVGEGKVLSLQRNKKVVKEIHSGSEFGFISTGFSDWQVDDVVHCFVETMETQST